jgi:glyoxylase-like metal-dependent hydrolase (beta-lactamase superfamily II)
MLRLEPHGDVVRLHMSWARSRLVGYSVSAYLVRGVLVDTGFAGAARALARFLGATSLRGAMLTHAHEDHAGNVELLAQRGVPLAMGDATRSAVRRRDHRIGLYRRVVWRTMPPLVSAAEPFAPEDLALLPAPGHSADHHVVWDADTATLFGGDLFLGVKVRVAHPGEDSRGLARTLRWAAALRPRRLFDAHRGAVRDPEGALLAKADWLDATIAAIDRLTAAGWDDATIRREVLGREGMAGFISFGDYSKGNLVRAVRRTRVEGGGRGRREE